MAITVKQLHLDHTHWDQACRRMGAYCQLFTLTCDVTLSNGKRITVDIDHETPVVGRLIGFLCNDACSGLDDVTNTDTTELLQDLSTDELSDDAMIDLMAWGKGTWKDFVTAYLDQWGDLKSDAPQSMKDHLETIFNKLADDHMAMYADFLLDQEDGPLLKKHLKVA